MPAIALICLYGIENNGIRTISAVLRKAGLPVYIIFFKRWVNNDIHPPSSKEKEMLISLLRELKVDLVGMSFTSPFFKIAGELTACIKKNLQAAVIWGGVHATARPEECLRYCDIVCRGEGEYTMLDLARAYAPGGLPSGVKNTCYLRGNQVIFEDMRPLIQDLDSLPFQDYAGTNKFFIDNGLQNTDPLVQARELRVLASRGCPFNCSYCYNSILRRLYEGQRYHRVKSVEGAISEIENALGVFKKIKKIKFDDDTFVFPKSWIDEFCGKYKQRVGLPFEILFNAECLNTEALSALKTAGLKRMQVGIQTGSPRESQEIYNRSLSLDKIRQTACAAARLKIGIVYDVMLDNPLAGLKDKEALVDFLLSLPGPFDLFVYSLTIFPGTALCELLLGKRLIDDAGVEGRAHKSFYQFRLSFSYPRDKGELFFACIVSLISKSFVPRSVVRRLNKSRFLRRHPSPLKWFAILCNTIKLFCVLIRMSFDGEMSLWKFREYGFPRRFLIQ